MLVKSLVVLFFVSLLFPDYKIGGGMAILYPPEIVVGLAALVALGIGVERNRVLLAIRQLPDWLKLVLVSFIIAGCIGAVVSPLFPQSIGAFKTWIVVPLLAFVLFHAYLLEKNKRDFLELVLIGFGLAVVARAVPGLLTNGLEERFGSYLGTANYFAIILAPLTVFTFWKGFTEKKWYLIMAAIIFLLSLGLSRSLGGLIGILVAAGVGYWYLNKFWKITLGVLLILAVVLGVLLFQSRTEGQTNSLRARKEIWATSAYMVKLWPITGAGLRGFEHHYPNLVGAVVDSPQEWTVAQPHNLLLGLWLAVGVLGLSAIIFLLSRVLVFDFPIPSQLALLAILGHGLIDTPMLRLDFMVLFWTYIFLIISVRKGENV